LKGYFATAPLYTFVFFISTIQIYAFKEISITKNNIQDYTYELQKNIFNDAINGNVEAIKTIIIKAHKSSDELLPVYFVSLLINNYERVFAIISELNFQKKITFETTIQVLQGGILGYEYYFSRQNLIAFYRKNNNLYKNDGLFSKVFNKNSLGFAESSSYLNNNNTYCAMNTYDDDTRTAWVEGAQGNGIGEWIKIYLQNKWNENNIFNELHLLTGYNKNEKVFKENNRIKKALIEFSSGQNITVNFIDTINYQIVPIHKQTIKWAKITILEVYKGTKYNDTCISEVKFEYNQNLATKQYELEEKEKKKKSSLFDFLN